MQNAPTFVTGLPRTRTYWLSQFLDSIPGVVAYHELSTKVESPEEFYNAMYVTGHHTVVNVDSALVMTNWRTMWPENEMNNVLVHRDVKEVLASLEEFLPQFGRRVAQPAVLTGQLSYDYNTLLDMTWDFEVEFHGWNAAIIPLLQWLDIEIPDVEVMIHWAFKTLNTPELCTSRKPYDMWKNL